MEFPTVVNTKNKKNKKHKVSNISSLKTTNSKKQQIKLGKNLCWCKYIKHSSWFQ
jgi:hypothetical protein